MLDLSSNSDKKQKIPLLLDPVDWAITDLWTCLAFFCI